MKNFILLSTLILAAFSSTNAHAAPITNSEQALKSLQDIWNSTPMKEKLHEINEVLLAQAVSETKVESGGVVSGVDLYVKDNDVNAVLFSSAAEENLLDQSVITNDDGSKEITSSRFYVPAVLTIEETKCAGCKAVLHRFHVKLGFEAGSGFWIEFIWSGVPRYPGSSLGSNRSEDGYTIEKFLRPAFPSRSFDYSSYDDGKTYDLIGFTGYRGNKIGMNETNAPTIVNVLGALKLLENQRKAEALPRSSR